MSFRVLGLDPGQTTGWFLCHGYEPVAFGSVRDPGEIIAVAGNPDVVVFEDAADLERMVPLRLAFGGVPWVGVTPEQLQKRLFSRVLSRKRVNGPLARREVVRWAFGPGARDLDPHAADAACLALWWLAGSMPRGGAGEPDLGQFLRLWDQFAIETDDGEESYQIVPPNTADPAAGYVSWASPLVQALAGARPGEWVQVPAPAGAWRCRLVQVVSREE